MVHKLGLAQGILRDSPSRASGACRALKGQCQHFDRHDLGVYGQIIQALNRFAFLLQAKESTRGHRRRAKRIYAASVSTHAVRSPGRFVSPKHDQFSKFGWKGLQVLAMDPILHDKPQSLGKVVAHQQPGQWQRLGIGGLDFYDCRYILFSNERRDGDKRDSNKEFAIDAALTIPDVSEIVPLAESIKLYGELTNWYLKLQY